MAPGEDAAAPGSHEKDCAWCKIMEQKICKPQYDAFDACMDREGEQGDDRCMELFEALRSCMSQKPSLFSMLRHMGAGTGGTADKA